MNAISIRRFKSVTDDHMATIVAVGPLMYQRVFDRVYGKTMAQLHHIIRYQVADEIIWEMLSWKN